MGFLFQTKMWYFATRITEQDDEENTFLDLKD
jgi:hypothetical protein